MEIRTIGIDLGKTVFHLVAVDARGKVVARKKCSRTQLLRFTSNLPSCLIGMEACAGSHFLGRALREQGHDVRLMPAQYVKPYVKTNKNDYIDAEACAEAVTRPGMRFVPGVMCRPSSCRCLCRQGRPIHFSFRQNRPGHSRHLVGQSDCHELRSLARRQSFHPGSEDRILLGPALHYCMRSLHEKLSQVFVSASAGPGELLLASSGAFSGNHADRGGKSSTLFES